MRGGKIIIGTRGSQLSLIQTDIIKKLLQPLVPTSVIEIVIITTAGDKNLSPIPLDTIGKGWFTKEIDRQLIEGKIDIAVHSLKDLLDSLTPGLTIAAIPKREDASEALVSRDNITFYNLREGAVIGTDSLRRRIQILKLRNDLVVKSVRGNVNKRLEKLDGGEYDGLILAVAGLNRLGLPSRIAQHFNASEFIPSPGQGALAVVTKKDNTSLNTILSQLNDLKTVTAVSAEREFSRKTGGGCSMPVGAYAEVINNQLTIFGMIGSEDGSHVVKGKIKGKVSDSKNLARRLAKKLLKLSSSWYSTKH